MLAGNGRTGVPLAQGAAGSTGTQVALYGRCYGAGGLHHISGCTPGNAAGYMAVGAAKYENDVLLALEAQALAVEVELICQADAAGNTAAVAGANLGLDIFYGMKQNQRA